ncbi:TPA: transposase [Legionella pneumophila]
MRQVTKYTESIKASVLSKALAPNAPSIIELAKEFNIPKATVYTWVINMKNKNNKKEQAQHRPKDRTPAFKLQAVMDTLGKTEEEQSAYCRAHGIYYDHIEAWRKQILESLGASASTADKAKEKENKAELQRTQDEMKALKSNLKRKDKALAELTALLVLKKKADLLWGESEGD